MGRRKFNLAAKRRTTNKSIRDGDWAGGCAWSSPHLNDEDTMLKRFVVLAMIKSKTSWRGV
jgi:hypothetical protein